MKQTRIDSFMEQLLSITVGFTLSALVWKFIVLPMIEVGWIEVSDTMLITGVFTIVSFTRGLAIRRLFNGKKPWATIKKYFTV